MSSYLSVWITKLISLAPRFVVMKWWLARPALWRPRIANDILWAAILHFASLLESNCKNTGKWLFAYMTWRRRKSSISSTFVTSHWAVSNNVKSQNQCHSGKLHFDGKMLLCTVHGTTNWRNESTLTLPKSHRGAVRPSRGRRINKGHHKKVLRDQAKETVNALLKESHENRYIRLEWYSTLGSFS
jgi:hypothetical protein